jgi:putative DNA primase/helicase
VSSNSTHLDELAALAEVETGPEPDPDVEIMIGGAGPKGRRATRRTLRAILQHDPRWTGRLCRDVFRDEVVLDGKPLTDADLTRTSCWIEEVYQATPSRDLVHEVAVCVADDQAVHPVQVFLGGLSWDGTDRIHSLLPDILGADDTPLTHEIGRAFIVGAVARIMRPGCKLDTMLVMVGPQGVGKSRFCAGLMPDPRWFGDTPIDRRSKDAYLSLRGKWIYEIAEMEGIRGRGAARVKAFLSSSSDNYRAPYARAAQDHPRQCLFVGTSNHPEVLVDGTGSRRFWPVDVRRVDLSALAAHRDQLWAEAAARFDRGEAWHLDPVLESKRSAASEQFKATDVRREMLEAWLDELGSPFTTADAIIGALRVPMDRVDRSLETKIGPLLHELGCTKERVRQGGKRLWLWTPPALSSE